MRAVVGAWPGTGHTQPTNVASRSGRTTAQVPPAEPTSETAEPSAEPTSATAGCTDLAGWSGSDGYKCYEYKI